MPRNYYIFSAGRLKRRQNTLYFEPAPESEEITDDDAEKTEDEYSLFENFAPMMNEREQTVRKPIPIEDVASFYCFGEIAFNSKFLNFVSRYKIPLHIFNYYGYYSGSYYPREYLNSGFLTVKQVSYYLDPDSRLFLAREFIHAAVDNILKNLKYYQGREKAVDAWIDTIEGQLLAIERIQNIPELMSFEGRIREIYYKSFPDILNIEIEFTKRVRRPPDNMMNALISFGNSMVYTSVLSELYHTQLNPTISYLHEPGERRFSLSLDLAEIFKPLLADRTIFKVLNKGIINETHFDKKLNACYLSEAGRKIFVQEFEERLKTTIRHRTLKRNVSYRHLIRLECYKLIKHLTGEQPYQGFRAWW